MCQMLQKQLFQRIHQEQKFSKQDKMHVSQVLQNIPSRGTPKNVKQPHIWKYTLNSKRNNLVAQNSSHKHADIPGEDDLVA